MKDDKPLRPRMSPKEAVAMSLRRASQLSDQREYRKTAQAMVTAKKSADRFKGVGRWGGEMFCKLFYNTLAQHGFLTRDVVFDDGKPQPRYAREMNIVLGLVEQRGRTKAEFADALVASIKNWNAGLGRKLSGKNASVYDLRYHLDSMFGKAIPTSLSSDPVDMSVLFQEDQDHEG